MKTLIGSLLALCLLVIPAEATHKQVDYAAVIGHAGCHAALTTSDQHSIFESFYDYGAHRLYIGTAPDGTPDEYALIVVLHETGHCLQGQEGLFSTFPGLPPIYLELDADRRAADMACRMGLDGPTLLHGIFVYAQERFGYEGDPGHGTLDQRIGTGRLALSCTPEQAPYMATRAGR